MQCWRRKGPEAQREEVSCPGSQVCVAVRLPDAGPSGFPSSDCTTARPGSHGGELRPLSLPPKVWCSVWPVELASVPPHFPGLHGLPVPLVPAPCVFKLSQLPQERRCPLTLESSPAILQVESLRMLTRAESTPRCGVCLCVYMRLPVCGFHGSGALQHCVGSWDRDLEGKGARSGSSESWRVPILHRAGQARGCVQSHGPAKLYFKIYFWWERSEIILNPRQHLQLSGTAASSGPEFPS